MIRQVDIHYWKRVVKQHYIYDVYIQLQMKSSLIDVNRHFMKEIFDEKCYNMI